jgi:hypothetical protein
MSIIRSLVRRVGVVLVWLALASCGGREADLVVDIHRGGHAGELDLYVCGEGPTSKCKPFTPFAAGSSAALSEVGIFVDDDTTRLDLQLQLQHPTSCARFFVAFAQDKQIQVQLDPSGGAPYTVSDCASCTAVVSPCTYPTRL